MVLARLALAGLLLGALGSGCAWRGDGAERYFGPVFYRHAPEPGDEAWVRQARHVGFLLEGGRQWGVALGYADRIGAAPRELGDAPPPEYAWSSAGSLPLFGGWSFSPFYLQGRGLPEPIFVKRTLLGVQLGYGAEVRSVSLGYAGTTQVRPPHDALYELDFSSDDPMGMRFRIWRDQAGRAPPVHLILKEDTRR
jgi:hypothetical protein